MPADFDHSAHAASVASVISYVAGGRVLRWSGHDFPALIESIPPRLAGAAPVFDRRGSDEAQVVVTVARALFAAKRVRGPRVGESFIDAATGFNYRVQKMEGAPTDAEIRFTCGTVTPLPDRLS